MMIILRWLLLISFVFTLSGCFAGQYGTSGRVVVDDDNTRLDISFSDHDRALLREHYGYRHHRKQRKIPPGLAKKNKLPPGIQKQLVRNGQLPPDLQYQRLPHELEQNMSRIPDGYIRVRINGKFILFNEQSRVIFDIIHEL